MGIESHHKGYCTCEQPSVNETMSQCRNCNGYIYVGKDSEYKKAKVKVYYRQKGGYLYDFDVMSDSPTEQFIKREDFDRAISLLKEGAAALKHEAGVKAVQLPAEHDQNYPADKSDLDAIRTLVKQTEEFLEECK